MKYASGVALFVALALCGGGGAVAADATGDWTGFGRTPDNLRHSPLTQIDRANVDRMGRVFTVDLRRVDPDVRRGQQSYPLAIDGTLYVTTNNNFVFALDGVTGKVKWEYKPRNSGLFVNFGVAANRGLAYCGGKLFMTTLDMQLVALRPSDGEVVGKIAISQFVPNASANYGYSQTSAPICAGGKLVMGAAGSEYGVRGYVMAFNTDLTPAWPNPYWTIPPEQQQWRRLSPDRRRRRRLDAGHDRHPHEHRLLRHRLRDAELLPRPPSRPEPARELADRGRPELGQAALVAAARRERPVELRRRAAAARLRREDRRQDAPDRLGRVEGRRLVRPRRPQRADAAPAGEGDRPGRAPAAPPRPAGDDLPLGARRRELLAGLVRPRHQLRLQRGGGDGRRPHPGQVDPDAEAAEADQGRRLPRAPERQLRHRLELARSRLDQRDQRRDGQAGVEVPDP